jgi:Ca-activated chloride channel family protein
MIDFREPWLLLTLLLAPLVFLLLRRPFGRLAFSSLKLMPTGVSSWRARLSFIPPLLVSLAMACLAVALAGPRVPGGMIREQREGIAIMMVIDRSGSMSALDLSEGDTERTRLDVVKKLFEQFVVGDGEKLSGRHDDAIGLVSFARYADPACPLTLDHGSLLAIADEVEIVTEQREDGTALGDALALAVERLRQNTAKSRVLILLTDGVSNAGDEDPKEAAKFAATFGIKVYTVGVGSRGLASVRVEDPFTGRSVLRQVPVEIDEETLQAIAQSTGGKYFRATDADSLRGVYEEIDRLEKTKITEERLLEFDEYYEHATALALVFASLGLILGASVFRRLP